VVYTVKALLSTTLAVLRKKLRGTETSPSGRFSPPSSQITISQEPPEIIYFEPMVKVNLVEIGGHDFLSHFVRLGAKERLWVLKISCNCKYNDLATDPAGSIG
jgi:hypothetical protein